VLVEGDAIVLKGDPILADLILQLDQTFSLGVEVGGDLGLVLFQSRMARIEPTFLFRQSRLLSDQGSGLEAQRVLLSVGRTVRRTGVAFHLGRPFTLPTPGLRIKEGIGQGHPGIIVVWG